MKKGIIAIVALVAFVALALLGGAAWAAKTKSGEVKDEFLIDNTKVFGPLTKAVVRLTHTKHGTEHKVACDKCHHVKANKKTNIWKEGDKVEKCAECHTSADKKPAAEGVPLSLYNALHKQCRECHKDQKKGPTKCDECHPKAK
ncbi:Cytochrome c3 family protein [Desulfarculales bacterium]